MQILYSMVLLGCLWGATGYPAYSPYYGSSFDTLSFGAADSNRGGMVMSKYYDPYYYRQSSLGGGMAAFMYKQPDQQPQPSQPSQYYTADRRRQTTQDINYPPPQQNEVSFPAFPEKSGVTEPTETSDPTEKTEIVSTTIKAIVPELTEPEVEEVDEPEAKNKKRVSKKKQVKKPIDEEDEGDDYAPKMPPGSFFPMFFGWGGRSGNGVPQGPTAVANAYSTGRGGVATSHATAYGFPRPDFKFQGQ